jgi:hypothetical protein
MYHPERRWLQHAAEPGPEDFYASFLLSYDFNLNVIYLLRILIGEEIPNILESFSQRHNTCISCRGNLKLAKLISFL